MADQRILMKCGDDEIVIAVRHGVEWRSSRCDGDDIGDFLNRIGSERAVVLAFEHDREWPDPTIEIEATPPDQPAEGK